MADEIGDQVENALNLTVSTTEQNRNMKKALKQKIFETVSTLSHYLLSKGLAGIAKEAKLIS